MSHEQNKQIFSNFLVYIARVVQLFAAAHDNLPPRACDVQIKFLCKTLETTETNHQIHLQQFCSRSSCFEYTNLL